MNATTHTPRLGQRLGRAVRRGLDRLKKFEMGVARRVGAAFPSFGFRAARIALLLLKIAVVAILVIASVWFILCVLMLLFILFLMTRLGSDSYASDKNEGFENEYTDFSGYGTSSYGEEYCRLDD
ncbi:MAG: DUF3742 family protein [Burkholderiales bacterium]|jgi:hypothetical protein|nr:DUF3742 family protein [Burkholderiales bacterium]